MLPQVPHVYPYDTNSAHPYHSIRLANLLTNEEIAHARIGLVVTGTSRDYLEFVKAYLQGCLADILGASINFFLFQINLHHDLHHFFILPFVKMSECYIF